MAESSDEFGARISDIVNTAYAGFSIFLGHDVGLFDILAKDERPRTSQEIADAGNLKERYVRELLNALVMSKIVELDPSGERYFLPGHRAAALVHGVPYEMYGEEAMDTMSRFSGPLLRKNLVTEYVSPYPELNEKLENGIAVLDIGCGQGVSTVIFGRAFPNSSICGIDFLDSSLIIGREMSETRNLKNVNFAKHDAANLPSGWSCGYDFVFMHNTLHDQAYPDKVLSETYRVLAPGGICLVVDELCHSEVKDNLEKHVSTMAMRYSISVLHCMPVSLHFDGGMGLGTCWGREKAAEMITAAGLELVRADEMPALGLIKYYCKKP